MYSRSFQQTIPSEVKGSAHKDWGPADERLALYVLLDLKLVPEHIEQRTLYNPLRPEMPQVQHALALQSVPGNIVYGWLIALF